MRNRLFILLFFISLTQVNAQTIHFLKSYGNTGYDYGRDIKQTSDTGYICTGSSSSFGSGDADVFLLKVDSLGNFKWSYNYGGSGSDWGQEIVITEDSSYAIGGYSNSFGAGGFDFYLVRADVNGLPLWEKTYGGSDWDKCNAMARIPADSGFVLVGETYSYGNGNRDVYIIRTNKSGDTLWTRTYGGTLDDYANGVLVDGDSIVICGGTESFGAGMADGIIIKMGIDGNFGWTKVVGKSREDYFTSIVKRNFYYTLGGTKSYTYVTDQMDFWVYKIFADGTTQMADTTWDGDQLGNDIVYDVVMEPSIDVVYYGGSTTSWGSPDVSSGITDCFISKLDPGYGWLPYVQNFGEVGSDALFAMEFCYDDGLVAIGDLEKYSTGGNNVLIVKIDKNNSFVYISVNDDITFDDITLSSQEIFDSTIKLSVYPNPTQSTLNISNINNIELIQLFDVQGNLIMSILEPENTIDISTFNQGIYFIEFTSETSKETVQIIKL